MNTSGIFIVFFFHADQLSVLRLCGGSYSPRITKTKSGGGGAAGWKTLTYSMKIPYRSAATLYKVVWRIHPLRLYIGKLEIILVYSTCVELD